MNKPLVLAAGFITALLMSGYASAQSPRAPEQSWRVYNNCPRCDGAVQSRAVNKRPPYHQARAHYRYYANPPRYVNRSQIYRNNPGYHAKPGYNQPRRGQAYFGVNR